MNEPAGYAAGLEWKKSEITDEGKPQFDVELRRLIAGLYNHPIFIVGTDADRSIAAKCRTYCT